MTEIRLVRHGETEYNADGIIQGSLDIPLNEIGNKQATALADDLSTTEFEAIYSSPLQRAHRTAEIIAERHDVGVSTIPSFEERNYGTLEGKHRSIRAEAVAEQDTTKSAFKPIGGEDCQDVVERARPKFDELARKHNEERILVVAHGSLNKSILSQLIAGTPRFAYRFSQDNTGVNRLRFDETWQVASVNSTAHLRALRR